MQTEQLYWILLRQAIGLALPKDSVLLDNIDWQTLFLLSQRQATAPLIYEVLLSLPGFETQPRRYRDAMKMACAQCMMAQEQQRAVMRRAIIALQKGGIKPVLLKGLVLAHHYPKPYLRTCGDVDIYVGKEAYHEGAKLLREAFPEAALFEEEKDYYKHYNLTLDTTAIEMHRVSAVFSHPKDERYYHSLEQDGLQNRFVTYSDSEDTWLEPAADFNVLFTFIHSWEHFVGETANVRQLCDLALLLAGYSDNKENLTVYLLTNLKKLHLLYAWQLYAYIMVNYLGLPQSACPLYTNRCAVRAESLLQEILHGDSRATATDNKQVPKNVLLRKLYTLRERIREAREIAKVEPHYARHMVATAFAQSWNRFKKGENTRKWE